MNPVTEYMDVDFPVTTKCSANLTEDNGGDYDGIQQVRTTIVWHYFIDGH